MSKVDEIPSVEEFIAQGEGQTVEFKRADILSNPIELAKLMVAFANASGGRILIGVCDDGSLEGMKTKKQYETHIMNIARDICDPPIIPTFTVHKKPEGDIAVVKVLRFLIFPHAVRTKEGRVHYIRVGSTVREATPSELALLFESTKEMTKKPKLELFLVDRQGNTTREICAEPTYQKIEKVEIKPELFSFAGREPAEDLVPIGIEISNAGEAPAHGIRVFLEFPEGCELISEYGATGGISNLLERESESGGLIVDSENELQALAWIDILGNDLTMRKFQKIYVRFPEAEQTYRIRAEVTQHNFPPEDFEFSITIRPKTRDEAK